ncbi:MAG TPA: carbon storage regulator [Terriglobales bacterium]|nr:carbon storage regulator [Terriglobales bacterium]HXZ58750.1 carbon storage regulator [Steroidobacteraceae bacterium]
MLVLTWKPGDSLRIGDKVTIRVLAMKGNRVRIGIDAPEDIAVHYEEIFPEARAPLEDGTAQGSPSPVSLRIVRSDK